MPWRISGEVRLLLPFKPRSHSQRKSNKSLAPSKRAKLAGISHNRRDESKGILKWSIVHSQEY
jgi:hypothetical protein